MKIMKGKRSIWVALLVLVLVICITAVAMAQGKTFFNYSDLKFATAPVVKLGVPLSISAIVKNIGAYEGTSYANLYVGGILADTKEINLEPGEAKEVNFSVSFSKIGMNEVSIANLEAQKVKIYEKPIDSSVLIMNFDEMEGATGMEEDLVRDSAGFGNHGIVKGEVKWVDGVFGKAVHTGDTGYLEIPESRSLDITGDTITMMIWFYPIDEDGYSDFFTKGDWNVLKMQNPTNLNLFVGGWGRGECMAEVPEDWNRNWHHVAGVCDGTTLKVYIDAELMNTLEIEGPIAHTDFPWNIGRNAQSPEGRFTFGYLDDARIYLEPLSLEDIQQIFEETRP